MLSLSKSEIRHRRTGWIVTIILHLALLLLLWLYKVWPFDPPMESLYGIQVNFGTTEVGKGDVQNEPTAASESETQESNNEETEPSESTESTAQSASETFETESDVTSPEETVEEVSEETVEETETETTNASESEVTEETNESTETSEESQNTDGTSTESESDNTEESTEGNDLFEGDKGSEEGEINESDIYEGSSTGEGGFSSTISGWAPDRIPRPEDTSNESGKIVFRVKIDEDGEIVSVNVVESSVSARVALIYQREVEKLSFHTTSSNLNPAPFSTGTVSFIIRAR